jgi:hypothetical protein
MFNRLWREFEIECDSPPYTIVQGCRLLGLQNPEDVRWCRLSNYCREQHGRLALLDPRTWKSLLGPGDPDRMTCCCGHRLPALERCTFTLLSGKERHYFLGQCQRCRTIFWEEAPAAATAPGLT